MFWYKLDNRYIQPMLLNVEDGYGTESWDAIKTSVRVWFRRWSACRTHVRMMGSSPLQAVRG